MNTKVAVRLTTLSPITWPLAEKLSRRLSPVPGFAADGNDSAARHRDAAVRAASSAVFNHADQLLAHQRRDLGCDHALASSWLAGHHRFGRSVRAKVQALDFDARIAHAIVHDDAHQIRQSGRRVAGNADGGGVRRHQRIEWISLALPGFVDLTERVLLGERANANVLLMLVVAAEQPPIHVLAKLGALPSPVP